MLTQG